MSSILQKVASFSLDILYHLPPTLCFHNYLHTQEVVEAAGMLAFDAKLSDEDKEIVLLAAWFHDLGYKLTYIGHEEESKQIAKEFLANENYRVGKIEAVLNCIEATKAQANPTSLTQAILCDADFYHLSFSQEKYVEKENLLRAEWKHHLNKVYTEQEWNTINLSFLLQHRYLSPHAKSALTIRKKLNIIEVQRRLTY